MSLRLDVETELATHTKPGRIIEELDQDESTAPPLHQARDKVFATTELFEDILLYLPRTSLLFLQGVCRQWRCFILTSKVLRRQLFMDPNIKTVSKHLPAYRDLPAHLQRVASNFVLNRFLTPSLRVGWRPTFLGDAHNDGNEPVPLVKLWHEYRWIRGEQWGPYGYKQMLVVRFPPFHHRQSFGSPEDYHQSNQHFNRIWWHIHNEASWKRMLLTQPPIPYTIEVDFMKRYHPCQLFKPLSRKAPGINYVYISMTVPGDVPIGDVLQTYKRAHKTDMLRVMGIAGRRRRQIAAREARKQRRLGNPGVYPAPCCWPTTERSFVHLRVRYEDYA